MHLFFPRDIESDVIETDIPGRLDRLPWSKWHWLIVTALGITWVLDGLEVTLAGAIGGVLRRPDTLGLSDTQVGASATFYLIGAVCGALLFGYLTDLLGRKKLFMVTLLLYLISTALTAFSWSFASYAVFRTLTGAGIGGEYSAINSAIDELIPARVRGAVDLIINSTFWIGAALGSVGTIVLLDKGWVSVNLGWRLAFGIGALLGCTILILRHWVPESPRWLIIHGHKQEAESTMDGIEQHVINHRGDLPRPEYTLRIRTRSHTTFSEIWDSIFHKHRTRSLLGLTLMIAQAFFYNAIFFTYALVLVVFYGVPDQKVGLYLLPFALGNFLGPLTVGKLFDSIGRKPMIATTYFISGTLLFITGWLFKAGHLTAHTQALAWTIIFFVASSAASAAYLTVSEIFPLEIRGMAIAVFYALGTLVGGVGAPALFGYLISTHSRTNLFYGYVLGAALMIIAAATELKLGVKAERQSLEAVTDPLSKS